MCLGLPGRVLEILDAARTVALVEMASGRKRISLVLLPADERVEIGDHVLVNVGYAMARIDAAEAAETRAMLEGFGQEFEVAAERHAAEEIGA